MEATTRECGHHERGKKRKRLTKGLPKKDSYFTVLRDAMTVDTLKSPAMYFGTTTAANSGNACSTRSHRFVA
jgi:hypothetical protein